MWADLIICFGQQRWRGQFFSSVRSEPWLACWRMRYHVEQRCHLSQLNTWPGCGSDSHRDWGEDPWEASNSNCWSTELLTWEKFVMQQLLTNTMPERGSSCWSTKTSLKKKMTLLVESSSKRLKILLEALSFYYSQKNYGKQFHQFWHTVYVASSRLFLPSPTSESSLQLGITMGHTRKSVKEFFPEKGTSFFWYSFLLPIRIATPRLWHLLLPPTMDWTVFPHNLC